MTCGHAHCGSCDRCLLVSSVVREIEEGLETAECSENEKEAKQSIDCWKAHLLRSVNQAKFRLDIMSSLSAPSILLVLDWAMKHLPHEFRESQLEWFGKRGIS